MLESNWLQQTSRLMATRIIAYSVTDSCWHDRKKQDFCGLCRLGLKVRLYTVCDAWCFAVFLLLQRLVCFELSQLQRMISALRIFCKGTAKLHHVVLYFNECDRRVEDRAVRGGIPPGFLWHCLPLWVVVVSSTRWLILNAQWAAKVSHTWVKHSSPNNQ